MEFERFEIFQAAKVFNLIALSIFYLQQHHSNVALCVAITDSKALENVSTASLSSASVQATCLISLVPYRSHFKM